MKFTRVFIACLIFLLANLYPGNIFSDNIEKADYYYQKYDYKLALDIYEKIYRKKPSLELAEKIANCYRFINNSEESERAYKRVLSYSGFDPVNYKYYADALKQNGKFDEAKANYQLFAQNVPYRKEEGIRLVNSTDVARMWLENPDPSVKIENLSFLNSSNSEFSPTGYLDGLVITSDRWFVKDNKGAKSKEVFGWTGNPYLKLYFIPKVEATADINFLDATLNDEFHNGPAVFTADGNEIYFTRTETPKTTKDRKAAVITKKLFHAVKVGTSWSKPKPLPFNSSSYSVQHPALSPDGTILYFASDMPGGTGGMDIYASKKAADGSWSDPVSCGPNINTSEDEVFPVVRKDGRFYFASKGHVSMGGLDLFTSEGSYDKFSIAENLKSPLNSTKDDFGVYFKDEKGGYFSSNRNGGKGLDDIYSFDFVTSTPVLANETPKQEEAEALVFAVEGLVIDKASRQPLANTEIVLVNRNTGEQISSFSDVQGRFNFNLSPETRYVVSGNRERYYSRKEGELSTVGLKESTVFNVKFELERAEDAYIVKLENIYYDFNKWNIRPDSYRNLNKVAAFLSKINSSNIQCRAHTDSRGKAIYNQWLSQKRAESAVAYLVNKGVASNRLSAVGLGETELLNKCSDGIKCSRDQHQLNRRTEFKILKVKTKSSTVQPAVETSTMFSSNTRIQNR
ncbi:OmpA family protein [Desertivirga brevis]|uniref:OmpA family protein n=1 Tax=Desertivirga brevis TaxID=2810310 RepID=UPI001A966518|nr:OmpA family protein [Pedobacter sp. SYSU D00873]